MLEIKAGIFGSRPDPLVKHSPLTLLTTHCWVAGRLGHRLSRAPGGDSAATPPALMLCQSAWQNLSVLGFEMVLFSFVGAATQEEAAKRPLWGEATA